MASWRKKTALTLVLLVFTAGPAPASPPVAPATRTVADGPRLPAGIFAPGLALPVALFNDGDFARAGVEARRVLLSCPTNGAACAEARLLSRLAGYLGGDRGLAATPPWTEDGLSPRQRVAAAYAIGVSGRSAMETGEARLPALRYVFERTEDAAVFWNASSLLYFTLKGDPSLRKEHPRLWKQLLGCRDAWPVEIVRASRSDAARAGKGPRKAPLPLRFFIRLYRGQLAPAIGGRCLLEPSCSEFYLQACRKHGWAGMALGGDRLVREPDVTGDPARAVVMPSGLIRYADPVSEHDYWMEGPPR